MKRKMWFFVLSLLGFQTACNSEKEEESVVCMYGTPNIDFTVSGTVRDGDGNTIQGIKVLESDYSGSFVTTDGMGSFSIRGNAFPHKAILTFVDVDGEKNGGDFVAEELTVEFTADEKVGEGEGWNVGSYLREGVDVVLEKKK